MLEFDRLRQRDRMEKTVATPFEGVLYTSARVPMGAHRKPPKADASGNWQMADGTHRAEGGSDETGKV